jgi:hypothetical protein
MSSCRTRPLAPRPSRRLFVLASFVAGAVACASNPEGSQPGPTGGSAGAGATAGFGAGGASAGSTATGGSTSGTAGSGTSGGAGLGTGGDGAGTAGAVGTSGSAAGGFAGVAGAAGSATGGISGAGGGGMPGMAGAAGAAGKGALGPGLTDVGTLTPVTCTITPTVTPATDMPLVGVATFSTDLAGAERAIIQFGKTSTYTLEAPVNWAAAMHRTLILGMPANTEVHYRVVVMQGNNACIGPDVTYRTGANVSGAPGNLTPTRGTSPASPAPGFIIAENGNFAYVINSQGEVVWAHRFPVSLTRAVMSYDGHYMYARDAGPFNASTGGNIYRVAMDGSGEAKLNVTGGSHHDLVATPTGFAYIAKQTAGACDCIFTANPDGSNSRCLVDLDVVFSHFRTGPGGAAMEECHVNAIRYYKDTDTYSVSDREKDAIAFISSTGQVLGSVGATPTSSTPNHAVAQGADSQTSSAWRVQHGHDWYEPNKLVLWSNGPFMGGQSKVLHYTINGATATLDWQYSATGNSPTLSDAQRLPNGNFLGTASSGGSVHEFDASQRLVQSFSALSRGYTCHRSTLYGPPPGR